MLIENRDKIEAKLRAQQDARMLAIAKTARRSCAGGRAMC